MTELIVMWLILSYIFGIYLYETHASTNIERKWGPILWLFSPIISPLVIVSVVVVLPIYGIGLMTYRWLEEFWL